MANAPVPAQPSAAAARKSWIGRHKLLTILIVIVLALIIGGFVVAWPQLQLRLSKQYAAAFEAVHSSPKVIERIGEPVQMVLFSLSGSNGDRESRIRFEVEGPKGRAKVFAFSRPIQGQWAISQLQVDFSDKVRIDLAQNLAGASDDTPKFDPNAKQPDLKEPDLPLDVKLPDLPAEPHK